MRGGRIVGAVKLASGIEVGRLVSVVEEEEEEEEDEVVVVVVVGGEVNVDW